MWVGCHHMKVGNHGNPTLVAIQYTHWHTHYIDSKFLYNIHTNNCPQCFDFTDFVDFLLKIGHFLFTGCLGKLKKIVRFKFCYFNFMNSFKPKLHLYIIKFACPCVCFLSKSIFKMCSKALNIPYFSLTHLIWYGWSALQGLNCAGLQISFQTGFALWIMHQSMILKYYTK